MGVFWRTAKILKFDIRCRIAYLSVLILPNDTEIGGMLNFSLGAIVGVYSWYKEVGLEMRTMSVQCTNRIGIANIGKAVAISVLRLDMEVNLKIHTL